MVVDASDVIIAVVAIYGAVMSTALFWIQLRQEGPTVTVRISTALMQPYAREGVRTVMIPNAGPSELQFVFRVSNSGNKPVTISAVPQIHLDKGKSLTIPTPNCNRDPPLRLADGESVMLWVPAKEVANWLREQGKSGIVEVTGMVLDGAGKEFYSERFKFNVDFVEGTHPITGVDEVAHVRPTRP
jgi:hypothetical protein